MSAHTIYFVRHGQTDWNAARRMQGQIDIPLNDTGRGQARRNGTMLKEMLAHRTADLHFVASPLSRASETMQIMREALALPRDPFAKDPRLMEMRSHDYLAGKHEDEDA